MDKPKCTSGKKAAKTKKEEKRLKRYRSQPTKAIRARIERALTQRLYLVHTSEPNSSESSEFEEDPSIGLTVLGSTGNIYEVNLAKIPHCNCPDHMRGNLCKHLLFVMLKVANLDPSSPLVYQSAYITSELKSIIEKIQNRTAANLVATGGSDIVANEAVRQHIQIKKGKTNVEENKKIQGIRRQEIEGNECPICFDDLGSDLKLLTFCQAVCGTNFHSECIKMWTRQHSNAPTCPACRLPWVDEKTGGKRKVESHEEKYENLASLQGQSRVRDTSTYNTDWMDYKRRRRY